MSYIWNYSPENLHLHSTIHAKVLKYFASLNEQHNSCRRDKDQECKWGKASHLKPLVRLEWGWPGVQPGAQSKEFSHLLCSPGYTLAKSPKDRVLGGFHLVSCSHGKEYDVALVLSCDRTPDRGWFRLAGGTCKGSPCYSKASETGECKRSTENYRFRLKWAHTTIKQHVFKQPTPCLIQCSYFNRTTHRLLTFDRCEPAFFLALWDITCEGGCWLSRVIMHQQLYQRHTIRHYQYLSNDTFMWDRHTQHSVGWRAPQGYLLEEEAFKETWPLHVFWEGHRAGIKQTTTWINQLKRGKLFHGYCCCMISQASRHLVMWQLIIITTVFWQIFKRPHVGASLLFSVQRLRQQGLVHSPASDWNMGG